MDFLVRAQWLEHCSCIVTRGRGFNPHQGLAFWTAISQSVSYKATNYKSSGKTAKWAVSGVEHCQCALEQG